MIDFIIMRHGMALPADEDSERGLSEEGRSDSRRVAGRLAAAGVRVERVVHSGKKRARETAEIVGAKIAPGVSIERIRGLEPHDRVDEIASELEGGLVGTAVIGHLPHLDHLLARLLRGSAPPTLGTSCAAHLRRSGSSWKLADVHRPGD